MMMSEEEIRGMSEAYHVYRMLSEEDKKKIPKKLADKLEHCYNLCPTKCLYNLDELKNANISRDGVKIIAYMCLLL